MEVFPFAYNDKYNISSANNLIRHSNHNYGR